MIYFHFHFHLKKGSSGRPLADQMETLRRGASPQLYHFTTTCHKLATQFVTICNDQINHYTLLPSISFIEQGRKSNSPLKSTTDSCFPFDEGSILVLALSQFHFVQLLITWCLIVTFILFTLTADECPQLHPYMQKNV